MGNVIEQLTRFIIIMRNIIVSVLPADYVSLLFVIPSLLAIFCIVRYYTEVFKDG